MKKAFPRFNAVAIVLIVVAVAHLQAQRGPVVPQMRGDGPAPAAAPFSITKSDPALDEIISPDAKLVELARGFGLTEGGLFIADGKSGYWIFTGLLDNVLYKVTSDKQVSVFMEKAGYTGNDPDHVGTQTRSGRSHVLLIGSSCTGMDHQGRVIWCADNDRQVMRLEKDGTHTVLSGGMDGKKFSGPNDITIAADDAVYVTDNDFGLRDGGKNPDKQLQNGIYRIKDNKTTLVLSSADLNGIPNGIALSPDGKSMYLSTSGRQIRRYAVNPDGTLGAFTMFTEGVGIGDGIKTDRAGNVFSTGGAGPGIVRITSPAGKLLGTINLPIYGGEPKRQICATNEAFGGPDGRTLFIAGCDSVYTIQLKTPGIVPAHEVKK
ncbi:MAG TPA: SMP-30/gluconolactonase/LRE family protein [Vicinamibacterales bacterium]|nr:SMP-30/gluconolactonase/LRE family protein [Vicinamibacterales bacterium]